MSKTMWPKGAAEKASLFIAQIAISESPSRITFSKPSSLAKKRALCATNTSTISTKWAEERLVLMQPPSSMQLNVGLITYKLQDIISLYDSL